MDRIDFLHRLYKELEGVPDPARRDMLSDYEEHFRIAAQEGRSEADTAAALGDPVQIARELLADRAASGPNMPPPGWSPNASDAPPPGWVPPAERRGCLSSCLVAGVLLLLNLIFVLGPALGVFGLLFGGWCASLGFTFGGVAALAVSFLAPAYSGWVPDSLSMATLLSGSVMMASVGILLAIGLWYATRAVFKWTGRYLTWTFNLIANRR